MTESAMIAQAKALLAEHGFVLTVGACGCCDSPWVFLSHNGVPIIHDGEGKPLDGCGIYDYSSQSTE